MKKRVHSKEFVNYMVYYDFRRIEYLDTCIKGAPDSLTAGELRAIRDHYQNKFTQWLEEDIEQV